MGELPTYRARTKPGVPALLILGVFLYFLGDALFQIALPTVLVESGGLSATAAGFMLSIGLGIGIFFVAPVAQRSDSGSRSRVLRGCVIPAAGAALLFIPASLIPFWIFIWVIPVVLYGLVRTPGLSVLLAYVTERGNGLRMQAANGFAQRVAVAIAACIIALLAVTETGSFVFIVQAAVFLALAALAGELFRREGTTANPKLEFRKPIRRSLALLRTRSLKASSALNASLVLVTLLGNAFYPLGLIGETPGTVAVWVLLFLVTRDLMGAGLAGTVFTRLYGRIGIVGVLTLSATFFVVGLGLLALPGRVPAVVLTAAILQGFACAAGVGCTNLLAAHGGGGKDRALRIGSTQYLPAAVILIAPAPFGMILDHSSINMVFLAGALLCLALMSYVLFQVSPKRNSLTSDFALP